MKIDVDLWIEQTGGLAHHVKGTIEVPDGPLVALLSAISAIYRPRGDARDIERARKLLEGACEHEG